MPEDQIIRDMKDLIHTMWIHSGYPNNGYWQMTTEQKKLYDSIIKEESGKDEDDD